MSSLVASVTEEAGFRGYFQSVLEREFKGTAAIVIAALVMAPAHGLIFFTLVWPYDATRRLVRDGGADAWFWAHTVQAIIFTVLAVLAFRQLAKVIEHDRVSRVSSAAV